MADQQAWDDFKSVTNRVGFLGGVLSNTIKDGVLKLEDIVSEIAADQERLANVAALADQHPVETSTYLLDKFAKLQAVRDALVAQGF